MYFEWTDDLDTGVEEVDIQHRQIVDYINTLHDIQASGDRAKLEYVLNQLVEYTIHHFEFEEHLMERANYEFRTLHGRVHVLFGKKVAEYRQRFARGEDVSGEVLTMLKNWLASHIKEEDKAYAPSVMQVLKGETEKTWVSGLIKRLFG